MNYVVVLSPPCSNYENRTGRENDKWETDVSPLRLANPLSSSRQPHDKVINE